MLWRSPLTSEALQNSISYYSLLSSATPGLGYVYIAVGLLGVFSAAGRTIKGARGNQGEVLFDGGSLGTLSNAEQAQADASPACGHRLQPDQRSLPESVTYTLFLHQLTRSDQPLPLPAAAKAGGPPDFPGADHRCPGSGQRQRHDRGHAYWRDAASGELTSVMVRSKLTHRPDDTMPSGLRRPLLRPRSTRPRPPRRPSRTADPARRSGN